MYLNTERPFMANLKLEVSNNDKNLQANKTKLSTNQYIQNTGQQVLGACFIQNENKNENVKRYKK